MRNFFLNINGINNLMLAFVLSCAMACTPDKSEQEPNLTKTFTVNGENFEMVLVEGGTFMMGGTKEQGRIAKRMKNRYMKRKWILSI